MEKEKREPETEEFTEISKQPFGVASKTISFTSENLDKLPEIFDREKTAEAIKDGTAPVSVTVIDHGEFFRRQCELLEKIMNSEKQKKKDGEGMSLY